MIEHFHLPKNTYFRGFCGATCFAPRLTLAQLTKARNRNVTEYWRAQKAAQNISSSFTHVFTCFHCFNLDVHKLTRENLYFRYMVFWLAYFFIGMPYLLPLSFGIVSLLCRYIVFLFTDISYTPGRYWPTFLTLLWLDDFWSVEQAFHNCQFLKFFYVLLVWKAFCYQFIQKHDLITMTWLRRLKRPKNRVSQVPRIR